MRARTARASSCCGVPDRDLLAGALLDTLSNALSDLFVEIGLDGGGYFERGREPVADARRSSRPASTLQSMLTSSASPAANATALWRGVRYLVHSQ